MKRLVLIALFVVASVLPFRSAGSDVRTGIGETILLVVADVVAPSAGPGVADKLNAHFGELQGFSVDATTAYDVRGVLVQTTADLTRKTCGTSLSLECQDGSPTVDALSPVGLRYLSIADVASYAFPSVCGVVGAPPCQRDRIAALLGTSLRFALGRSIVATGFRTKAGAEQFIEFARSAGVKGLLTVQVLKVGGGDIGLGQEPHPNGSGPLSGPLDDQLAFQR